MPLKQFNPTTPSQRNLVLVDKSALHKGGPVKKLTEGLTKSGGRNNSGHVTAWQRGGGHKRRYRMIDFKRRKQGINDNIACLRLCGTGDRGNLTLRNAQSDIDGPSIAQSGPA